MKALADILISLLELLEAEGRSLRQSALRVGLAMVVYAVAGALLIAGALLLLAGLHAILAVRYGATAAHFATGALALALAAGIFAAGTRIARGGERIAEGGDEADRADKSEEDDPGEGGGLAGGGEGELSPGNERGEPQPPDRQAPL